MARVRKKSLTNDEEQGNSQRKGKRKVSFEEDDDEEGLDEFEVDGFLVDNDEDEGGGEEEMLKKKKKKRKKSSKGIVLDDDDLELIRENKNLSQEKLSDGKFKRLEKTSIDTKLMGHSSDDEGSLFDDFSEDESNDAEDDMADFIVDEEVGSYGKGDSLRQKKLRETKQSSLLSKKAKCGSGKAGSPEEHNGSDDPKNMYVAGEGNSLADTDIPERLQIIEDTVGSIPVDRMSIEEESSWIICQITSNIHPFFSEAKSCGLVDAVNREDIIRFLELHHIKKYDIPFIAMYRKEQCPSLLQVPKEDESEDTLLNDSESKPKLNQHKILWIIKELDKKWLLLQKRKSMLKRYYNKHFEEECQMSFVDEESSFRKQIYDSIIDMLEKAETEREIDDVDMKFNLYFPPADEFFSSGYKRPQMKSYYSECRKAGLSSLAIRFGNPDNFSSVVTLNKVGIDSVEDPDESLEEMASIYKCETFQSSEAVLKGARHMAALMLSCEVPFRKHVRSLFMDKALVSTNPTLKGSTAIDSFHECAGFKWLKDKPLLKFEDSQWLLIQKAEEEKLLQVEIKFPDNSVNELMMTCNSAYLTDSEGASTQLWNEQRKSILQDTITNLLLPSMEKEARALLNAKAKNWLLMKYGTQLWNRVSVASYLNNGNANAQERGVMACCWGNGKPGTTFVMLDSRGELVDVMHAGSLTLRSQNINDQQRRKNDQKCVLKFLTIHRPNVIVVGAANASCVRLKEDINEIISMMSEDNFQDASQEMSGLPAVVLGDEDLPRLYEDSEISTRELPRQYGIVKRAVALGRYLLNPLVMVATLCGVNKEVVSWKLNPLEKFLSIEEKMEMIDWIMINITNQVGIDVNLGIRHDWLLAPLQFVSGLGPKKAGILHRELLGGTDVRNRRDFAKFGLNSKKVFCNAVGFLKVSCDDPNFVDTAGNILDRTRIHPESYSLADELAKAVIHRHYADADDTQLNAIECIQNDPKLLDSFDLNEYANRLEVEKSEYRRVTLYDIKMELLHGFKDPRSPYKEPTQDDEFCMITGGTGATLVEGERVQATVRRVLSRQAFCELDSGVSGILFREDFSDDIGDISLTEKLREGVVLSCKIKLIDKNRCQVNLTCKVSELKNVGEQSFHDMDPYYCQGDIILPSQQEAKNKQELAKKSFLPRTISHPHFQNITADQAKEFLADKSVGEYIFHPSSKGLCYLTISLKFFNELFVQKDILEGGKSPDMKSLPGLGKTLKVGEQIFESIDEVIERYVNPLVVNLKAFINFRKFKKGSKAEVDELLKLEKEEYPNRIPYGFGISYEHPGIFILSYIRSTNPRHEFIAIHPKGFKFRKQIFNNVEQLVAYFQSHINDNVGRAKDKATVGSKGGSGGACYKCGESGHMARDCSQEGGGGQGGGRGGGGACYKCGEPGHMSRDCTQEGGGGGGGGACYKCGESGHMARDCTQEGGGGGSGGACYKCGESGHMARECSQSGGGGGGACYKCGESGHLARECSQGGGGGGGGGRACYKCGESGHMARDCTQENGGGGGRSGGRGGGGGGGGACYKCGESGHMARDCTQGSDYNDNGDGRGGGFGRGRGGNGGGRGFGSSSHSHDDSISDGGGGWGGTGGGSGWGGTGGKIWGGKSTDEESNVAEGSWGLKAASNAGTGNENSGWGSAQENNATPSGGGGSAWGGWGGTDGKSWGEKSTNEESKTAKGSWGLAAASNAASGNDCSGWNSANGKNAIISGSDSGWGGTGGKSWGGNSTNEESKIEKSDWGSGNGWGGTGGGNDSQLGGTGDKSWGGNTTNGESKIAKGNWGGGSGSGWGGTGGKSWGGNSVNEESSIAEGEGGGYGGGRGNGRGGRGGGGACYKCGESGHMARECSQGGEGGGRGGGSGRGGGRGSGSCYNCGESGHMARECSQSSGGRGGRGGGVCFKCGESGHMARDCTQDSSGGGWRGGGGPGGGRGGGGGACYKCGESGHMARDCSQGGGGGGGRYGGISGSCYKCGESGHFARECPASTN